MWKIGDFFVNHVLREINFEDSRSAKYAILTHLEALNFDFYAILHFLKAEFFQIYQIQSPKNGKNCSFRTSRFCKSVEIASFFLRFYVKSKLTIDRALNLVILTFLEAQKFDLEIFTLTKVQKMTKISIQKF